MNTKKICVIGWFAIIENKIEIKIISLQRKTEIKMFLKTRQFIFGSRAREVQKDRKMEKKTKLDDSELERQLGVVLDWVKSQIEKRDVPRFVDVVDYAHRVLKFTRLSRKTITNGLRLLDSYAMNSPQKRQKLRSDRNRPMIVNSITQLHADIGFYSVTRDYETPLRYRSGFLVCKNPLTRFIFVEILDGDRKAATMVKAFRNVFAKFQAQYPGKKITSVAFDREKSVTSNLFQDFLRKKNILFHAFFNTSSKSKMAESAIKLIRTTVARLKSEKEKRWWKLIDSAVASLNSKPIRINGKFLKEKNGVDFYAPKDVTVENSAHFIRQLKKADASYLFGQFEVDSRWCKFVYRVGDFVRPKLIVTSSEVLGTKRSEVTLEEETFQIKKCLAYVSRRNTIEKAYTCVGLKTEREETFQEDEIALAPAPE